MFAQCETEQVNGAEGNLCRPYKRTAVVDSKHQRLLTDIAHGDAIKHESLIEHWVVGSLLRTLQVRLQDFGLCRENVQRDERMDGVF